MNLRKPFLVLIILTLVLACAREKEKYYASDRTSSFRKHKLVAFSHDLRGVREIQAYTQPRMPQNPPVLRDTLNGWGGKLFSITIDQEISSTVRTDSLISNKDGTMRLYIYSYYPVTYHVSIDHGGSEMHTISFTTTQLMKSCWSTLESLKSHPVPASDIRTFTEEGSVFKDIFLLPEMANGVHPIILRYNPNHSDMLLAGISDKGVTWCLPMHSYEPEKKVQFTLHHTAILLEHYMISMYGGATDLSLLPGYIYTGGLPMHDQFILWYDTEEVYDMMPEERRKSLTRYQIISSQGELLDSFAVNAKSNRYQGTEYIWYDTARKTVYLLSQGFDSLYSYSNSQQRVLTGRGKKEFLSGPPAAQTGEVEIRFSPRQKFRSFVHTGTGKVRIAF